MQPSVLIVMGVSGSGKSTVGALLAQRLGWDFADGDGFHSAANVEKMRSGRALTDEDRRPWLHSIAAWIDARCKAGRQGVVACSALKRSYRSILAGRRPHVRLIYLQVDADIVRMRVSRRRQHFMPAALLQSQLDALEAPGADENPVIVDGDAAPAAIVSDILARLGMEGRPSGAHPAPE